MTMVSSCRVVVGGDDGAEDGDEPLNHITLLNSKWISFHVDEMRNEMTVNNARSNVHLQ